MVKAWKEQVVIPTYEVGKPEKNPVFLETRVYQGSSGVVYPYPVIESMADVPTPHSYEAVYIENEYLKVMILPELGGRVQMAYDKLKERHFVYYNHVIKPALVGLAGPWISGGIEFNWPQHHRPSTFMPVDCKIEENRDGSVTVWVNERERMFHQQGQAGFTLRPGCAYLEIQGRLYNPTEVPQTFLWWANPAVAVNDHYQSVFPPDVNAVFDHGKRAVSTFPIATGTYYKMDYSAGVDISNYRNIKVPTSYMVAKSKYNFEGGYENDTQAGMLHVADHHVAPGKKQWTWGNGDFGRAWDRNLTDEDGPYIELMAGVFTENQPDFSWLMPYEEKSFVQYFMPYRELGMVKNASRDFMINFTPDALQVFATSHQRVTIRLRRVGYPDEPDRELMVEEVELSPENIYRRELDFAADEFRYVRVEILQGQRVVLWYQTETDELSPIPQAAEAALRPEEIKTTEQLYLTGLHLEQYRHATWSALDYYQEALRRDPDDVRCNNAMGVWLMKRGRLTEAETYLRRAVKVLQRRNLNPYDGEPLYNLALCYKYEQRYDEAYDWAYKSTWNAAWQMAGFMMCAQLSSRSGNYEEALAEVNKSLVYGWHNHKARALKMALLCLLNEKGRVHADELDAFAVESLSLNPFNYGILFEQGRVDEMKSLMHDDLNNYDELALDYMAAGLNTRAVAIWELAIAQGIATAMTYYYISWAKGGDEIALEQASSMSPYFIHPNSIDALLMLRSICSMAVKDYKPYYLLGNLYYDKRDYELAKRYWMRACELDAAGLCPTVRRNLALLAYNKEQDATNAERLMREAFGMDSSDARIFMEYDQLLKRLGRSAEERLSLYAEHASLIALRDDLVLEHATLLNDLGRYAEAKDVIDHRIFHPWEGGEGKVSGQYQRSRIELAKQLIAACIPAPEQKSLNQAIALLQECLVFPHNLGEGKLYGAQDNDIYYYLGKCYKLLGQEAKATEVWLRGTEGPTEPAAALYYNDAKPEKIYFAALCYRALGQEDKARGLFYRLVNYGKQHYHDHVTMDYFAVSLPDLLVWNEDLDVRNRNHCQLMMSLGRTGLSVTQIP